MQVKPLHTFKYKTKNENIVVNEGKSWRKERQREWGNVQKEINVESQKERKNKRNNKRAFQSKANRVNECRPDKRLNGVQKNGEMIGNNEKNRCYLKEWDKEHKKCNEDKNRQKVKVICN